MATENLEGPFDLFDISSLEPVPYSKMNSEQALDAVADLNELGDSLPVDLSIRLLELGIDPARVSIYT